ncbi:MAG: zf-TFIIB domain-containing protein [Candidatus Binataceae bacterium]|nr:zf-TFIIB domain-containing protein [Candidatus Binataceae bacterium]
MSDEKNRFGDKLHELEKARENLWAAEQDRKLIEQMRARVKSGQLLCPKCHEALVERSENGVIVMACPKDEGAWLDSVTLKRVLSNK